MLHPYSKLVDNTIIDLCDGLEKGIYTIKSITEHWITIQRGDDLVQIWNANKWYAWLSTGHIEGTDGWKSLSPSRTTMVRFDKVITKVKHKY